MIGIAYESNLFLIGKPGLSNTTPFIVRFRACTAGYIFTLDLIFTTFMIIEAANPKLLNMVILALVAI